MRFFPPALAVPFMFLMLVLIFWGPALAGGPALTRTGGGPIVYPNGGQQIPYSPDAGGLGPFSPAEAVALVQQAFGQWEAIPTASATFVNAGLLPQDIDSSNFQDLLFSTAPDGISPVIFDSDGSIFQALFGGGSAVLGIGFPEWVSRDSGVIIESLALFNGQFQTLGFPPSEMLSIMVHELGHFSGLTHAVVNNQIARLSDETGPTPFDTFPPISLMGLIETMSPRAFINGGQATPHRDDRAAFSFLYPAPGFFQDSGAIEGVVLAPDGRTPLNGVNVIARNVAAPFTDAVSGISGNLAGTQAVDDPLAGFYTLEGLTPGATYAVYIDELEDSGFAVPALSPLPGPEEFYNGAQESTDPRTDDPAVFTPLVPMAGVPLKGINIVTNRLAPGPLHLARNSTQQIFLPFPFSFCGQSWDSFFVSSNGNITFGVGDVDRTPTAAEFLGGPPRIAPLWTNLNPAKAGEVAFSQTRRSLTLRFDAVPRAGGGPNSFELRLEPSPSRFRITYGTVNAQDGLAGYSCGGLITSGIEREVDLSRHLLPRGLKADGQAAFYEQYDSQDNDLDHLQMEFASPGLFPDRSEPNGQFKRSPITRMPLDTTPLFTSIAPLGNDIDFFRFRAPAGAFLIAETAAANSLLDTILGLFDATTGQILAADDDSGPGVFARMVVRLPSTGHYALAVSTFPDIGFTGAGEGFGRYRLNARVTREEVLPLKDDDSREVFFQNFSFPFQGQQWDSVFVNSNGTLTFGEPDLFPFARLPFFLSGPPRLAVLWDDLDPASGGLVTVERAASALTIRFNEVPRFMSLSHSSFQISLGADGTIRTTYGTSSAPDTLVGLTGGQGAADPGPVDLSTATSLSTSGTIYESFPGGTFDLAGQTLVWSPPPPAPALTSHPQRPRRTESSQRRPSERPGPRYHSAKPTRRQNPSASPSKRPRRRPSAAPPARSAPEPAP